MPKFPGSKAALVGSLVFLFQAAILYSSMRPESVPPALPLAEFPSLLGSWHLSQVGVVDQETQDILKADDLLDRAYESSEGRALLFVAAFRSTRNGKTPHSPKNCLPGSGWSQIASNDAFPIRVDGQDQTILVNRYVVEQGSNRSVVLYWYESRDRIVANEFKAKFWMMADAIKLNRTDTALVRVVVNIDPSTQDDARATTIAVDFVKSFFGPLHRYLPA